MNLIFELSREGHGSSPLPAPEFDETVLPASVRRSAPAGLPCLSEVELSRHYTALAKRVYGVNDGFYPLGSCTMKYNPRIDEETASLPGFTGIHPLQPSETAQGCLAVLELTQKYLSALTGMDSFSLQPAAGAQGEFTGLLLFKAYHASRGDTARTKIIVPDSAHGTNPASAAMAGFEVVNIPSGSDGCVDLDALSAALSADVAGLMLTNPNTVGILDKNIHEITRRVHEAGGLCYYDGANLNAIVGRARPGDMGFDAVHVNLHKTFGTPHGGGGPGSGPCGCKAFLAEFLPKGVISDGLPQAPASSIGRVGGFYGNFLVVVKALTYMIALGGNGLREASAGAVLNANYLKTLLTEACGESAVAYPCRCMHEFVLSLDALKRETGVSALDVAKALIDGGIHPPTMYFPLIVHEALMFEPTETETKETLDKAATLFASVFEKARSSPETLHASPLTSAVGRPDETLAAREPVLTFRA